MKLTQTADPSQCLPCSSCAHAEAASAVSKVTKTRSLMASATLGSSEPAPGRGERTSETRPCSSHAIRTSASMSAMSSSHSLSLICTMFCSASDEVTLASSSGGRPLPEVLFMPSISASVWMATSVASRSTSLPSGETDVLPITPSARSDGRILSVTGIYSRGRPIRILLDWSSMPLRARKEVASATVRHSTKANLPISSMFEMGSSLIEVS
mmetsp:Transcript_9697/g.16083  ORF Transcript_9697/g.16083 Transcript_9697/m.16083 type:complete len:212 (-) Transcript_9697:1375-2010(-)